MLCLTYAIKLLNSLKTDLMCKTKFMVCYLIGCWKQSALIQVISTNWYDCIILFDVWNPTIMIQNIVWRHYVFLNTRAGVAFCTKVEFPDFTIVFSTTSRISFIVFDIPTFEWGGIYVHWVESQDDARIFSLHRRFSDNMVRIWGQYKNKRATPRLVKTDVLWYKTNHLVFTVTHIHWIAF